MVEAVLTTTTCDGPTLRRLAHAGLRWLEHHYEAINRLNVFPVPDGDTGTNMVLTLRAAYHAVADGTSLHVGETMARLAHGALHGSRGNSGTVLSQLFVGFAGVIQAHPVFDARHMAAGFQEAVRLAYQTFEKPAEGTILTVARAIATEVEHAVASGISELRHILKRAVAQGKQTLARTPEMMPILKKAGVVDSGGQGLIVILEGMLRALYGQQFEADGARSDTSLISEAALNEAFALSEENDADGFGFDVQYIVNSRNGTRLDPDSIREAIRGMGRSAIVVGDTHMVKVHVHVPDPAVPLRYGESLGVLSDVVVEDMQAQSEQYRALRTGIRAAEVPPGTVGVISVVPGEGLRDIFYDLGAAYVVAGGQTMNPSTGELLAAINRLQTDKIILLPNNPNVILTAQQAARLAAERMVQVIPTRTIPQGVGAMVGYSRGEVLEVIVESMTEASGHVRSGEITRATRSLHLDGLHVQHGQLIGLIDGKLAVSGETMETVAMALLARMNAAAAELITLYSGEDVMQDEAEALVEVLQAAYPTQEFTLLYGGQPHYPYLISVE